ncbi:MAG: heterodisulfide reductase-related iron-sulfur binding cluster [Acidimicrobiia bacterium]|nr:heterodisulfide reductase-related iron-sulfur binding cluster [Acidimicrobiia bacterium]
MNSFVLAVVEGETRKIFEDIDILGKLVFYLLTVIATAAFAWGWWKRIAKYRQGRSAARLWTAGAARTFQAGAAAAAAAGDPSLAATEGTAPNTATDVPASSNGRGNRIKGLAAIASGSPIAKGDRAAGIAHFFIFWGFITLFIGTVILTIDEDVVKVVSRQFGEEQSFFQGAFYKGYSFILDTMGFAAVVALAYMAVRRGLFNLPQLNYDRSQEPSDGYSRSQFQRGDQLFIGLLGLVLITGFLHEGFRIRASEFPDFEIWSPVGWVLARMVSGVGLSAADSDTIRLVIWWIHSVLALVFVAYIPYSKAMHMITDGVNLVAHDPQSTRSLPAPVAGADHLGLRTINDFTWKQLLDLDSCTKCGRCHVVCPAHAAGAPLSPRDLILDLRQWAELESGTRSVLDHEERPSATGPLSRNGAVAGAVVTNDTLWSCTTCMACVEACPVGIEHVPTIVDLRRSLIEDGDLEPTLQDALQNIAQKGNSFGKSARQRARWTKPLEFSISDARKEPVRYLWYVGDFASFDERLQELSRTLARILHDGGVDFGILYEAERNSGNDVRRVGEEGLFDMLVEQNLEALASAQYEEIITTDPHTLNTLRNEYPERGLTKPVKHYTELLAELVEKRELSTRPLGRRVTYHDPCYLARYNRVTDAPRRLLKELGCELIEMPRNRENTFCCGAGGGRIWMDDSDLTERPSENRIREAAELNVEAFVVACPKDFTMYTDAAKTTGHDEQIAVVDIIQLVDEALSPLATAAGSAES